MPALCSGRLLGYLTLLVPGDKPFSFELNHFPFPATDQRFVAIPDAAEMVLGIDSFENGEGVGANMPVHRLDGTPVHPQADLSEAPVFDQVHS